MKRLALALAVVIAVAACGGSPRGRDGTPPPAAVLDPEAARLDAAIAATLKGTDVVGLSVAVARGDHVILAKGYGFADLDKKLPATVDTVYRIGSVTKQFTAVAILQLVEQGKLALGDDLRTYLPDYPEHDRPITIENLLTHTSGIYDFTQIDGWKELGKKAMTRAQLVAIFANKPLDFAPGTKWEYSNSNYYLLGLIIEKLTGTTYAEAIRDRVLRPAGMMVTGYCDDAMPHYAAGYSFKDGVPSPAEPLEMAHAFAAGGLCSTVGDLIKWQHALDAGTVIAPASIARMRKEFTLADGTPTGYGYALFLGELEGHPRIFHGGGINGFTAELTRFPDDDLTIAVLANAGVDAPHQVDDRVARVVLGLPEPTIKHETLTAAERARYLGNYEIRGFGPEPLKVRVFEDGDKLMTQATDQPAATMIYQGNDKFRIEEDKAIELLFSPGTPAPGFTLVQSGVHIEVVRVE